MGDNQLEVALVESELAVTRRQGYQQLVKDICESYGRAAGPRQG